MSSTTAAASDADASSRPTPGRSIPVDWERLARARTHPLQIAILEVLGIDGGRVLSPTDLSFELQVQRNGLSYHVTALAKVGLIVHVRQRAVRGAMEHFYALPMR